MSILPSIRTGSLLSPEADCRGTEPTIATSYRLGVYEGVFVGWLPLLLLVRDRLG